VRRLPVLLALAGLALAAPGALAAILPDGSPLEFSADNLTGSHGPEDDFVMLNGNVRMTRGRTVVTSDAGRYYKAQGMFYLDGRVRMVDSVTTMTCDHASYSENLDLLFVQGNVKLVDDKDSEIRAPSGTYDRRSGRAELAGPVEGRDQKMILYADRAVYLRDSSLMLAREHVRGIDQENKTELEASAVDYDRVRKVAVGTGDPVLRSRADDGRITELRALRLVVDTEKRLAEAIDSVRISRDTLQVRGDRAVFDDLAQRGWVTGSPRAWDDQTTVSGDTLEFHTDKRAIQAIVVRHDAVMNYVGSRPTTLGEASQLTGDTATVYFTRGEIDSLVAVGKARNQYTGIPGAGKTSEQNEAAGDTITVFFRERKIDRARVQGGARGTYRIAVNEGDTTAAKQEVVEYDARRIEFRVAESTILLDQEAHLTYQDLELRARQVEYDIERQTVEAQGAPVLGDRGEQVKGGLMTYDLPSRVGTIYDAQTNYEKGLYLGQRIRKVSENELDVMNGTYTTCSETKPHYRFSSRWMKIFLKDKLVAKPVVFYLGDVPLMVLPFWVFPVKSGRRSGFLFPQFGLNNSAGQFIRNAGYYGAPNDYTGFTVAGDYYQAEPSWVLRGDGEYRLLYRLDGSFRGTYARNESPLNRSENWDFSADHSQEVTPRTRLVARASFVSSKDYNSSNLYGRSLSQRLNRFLTSSLAISHNAEWGSINAVIDRRQDLNADQGLIDAHVAGGDTGASLASLANLVESMPTLSISFPTRAIGSLGLLKRTPLAKPLRTLYFGLSSQFISYSERRAFIPGHALLAANVMRDSITTRRGLSNSIAVSDSRKFFGWLNFQPQLRSNVVVFDFDELGHKVVPAGVWSSSVTMSTTFYGSFQPRIFGVEGLRHVVSPSASLSYSPKFPGLNYVNSAGLTRNRFRSFSGVGISGFQRSYLNFSLDQRLQAKLKRGGNVTRLDNLLSWSVAGSYDFLYKEGQGTGHPLSNLSSNVLVQPPSYLNANLNWVTDVYSARPVRSLGYNLGLNLDSGGLRRTSPDLPVEQQPAANSGENWSLGFAYSYSGGYSMGYSMDTEWASAKTANLTSRYQLSPAWALDYSASLDLTLRSVQTQRFSLSRDLHCWEAVFTRLFMVGGEAEYYFRIGVKDQKEIFLERGTRAGSLGGIQ
jgi:lipopolysaccharide assembly outer membrane protein LptD (OstA)